MRKLLVIDVAALGWNVACQIPDFYFQKAASVFPAVTCTAQATFRTASYPSIHGLVSNGLFFNELRKPLFWEQSSNLVHGPRIWEKFRNEGGRVGMMFWQQSLGESVDLVLSPAPIHKHAGGMIQDCYCEPRDLQARLIARIGRPFNLMHYWGPLALHKSSDWIVDATLAVMEVSDSAADLLFVYVPHLDYDLQRYGPEITQARKAREVIAGYLKKLRTQAETFGYDWLIFGDYTVETVSKGAVFPNQALRDAGLFRDRIIQGMSYPDFYTSRAFAITDHQIAHVYTDGAESCRNAKELLERTDGVAAVLNREEQKALNVDHTRAGDLLLVAGEGAWFAYPWWRKKQEAPDFANHVDIHNKPGYDPCELFFGWPPLTVSTDVTKVRGTHGRGGRGNEIAWASSMKFREQPETFTDLAKATKFWLDV